MEQQWIDMLLSGGPVGMIAALLFWLYWQERKISREVVDTLKEVTEKYEEIVRNNTEAITRIVVLINERLPGRNS